jgi:8-oxo-dGTP pyrophosphatase MutT (NUDIX family)
MAPIPFDFIPEVYLLLSRNGEVLLLKRKNTGYHDGNYGLIAGHKEEHESILSGLIREAREEAGLELHPKHLRLVHVLHRSEENERVGFFFVAEHWDGDPINMEPEKCEELRWFPVDRLPENAIPYIRQAIMCWRAGVPYSDTIGREWQERG